MATKPAQEKVAVKASDPRSVRITTSYVDFSLPFEVEPIVQRMLDSVPEEYLNGLSEVVLTNTAGMSRGRRRAVTRSRKRKVRMLDARGLYHPAWHRECAWIEIFVDNCVSSWTKGFWLRFSFIREVALCDVLFHELGHHIHFTRRPEYRDTEDVADVWKVRLQRQYYSKRFPLLRMFVRAFKVPFRRPIDSLTDNSLRNQLNAGFISRAEFNERMRE